MEHGANKSITDPSERERFMFLMEGDFLCS